MTLLTNAEATAEVIKRMLVKTLPKRVRPGDTLYVFLATASLTEGGSGGTEYVLGHDSDREDLRGTALAVKDVSEILARSFNDLGRAFLFVDACQPEQGDRASLDALVESVSKRPGNTLGLLSSCPGGWSATGDKAKQGPFTYHLLDGLMGGADRNKDGLVNAGEIVAHVQSGVKAATNGQQNVRAFGNLDPERPVAFLDRPAKATFRAPQLPTGEGAEVRSAFSRALKEGRLLAPAPNNAWELYQRYVRLPIPQPQKDDRLDDLVIALANAGQKVLWAYRRGDPVIRLDAAKYDEGAQMFAHANRLDPEDVLIKANAKLLAGRALVAKARYQEAERLLREAIELDSRAASGYNALGICFYEQGQRKHAIKYFKAASERAINWVYPHANMALAYLKLRQFRKAEREYQKGIYLAQKVERQYPYLHTSLGTLYLMRNRIERARQQFERAIEMDPGAAVIHYNLELIGRQLLRTSRFKQAEQVFRKVLQHNPDSATALSGLGDVHFEQRKFDLAAAEYREALRRTSDPSLIRDLEVKLNSIAEKK